MRISPETYVLVAMAVSLVCGFILGWLWTGRDVLADNDFWNAKDATTNFPLTREQGDEALRTLGIDPDGGES